MGIQMVRKQRRRKISTPVENAGGDADDNSVSLIWIQARYHLHTFCYRDPRSAFSSPLGIPVVSPTAVLLGIASTLFNLGRADDARAFIGQMHSCRVAVDSPNGAVFFRAFHQLRRYETTIMK